MFQPSRFFSRNAFTLLALLSLLSPFARTASADPDGVNWSGTPSKGLDPSTYAPMEALRLRGARTVWINKDFFRQRGYDVDTPEGLEFIRKKIEDEFGYLVPTKKLSPKLFGDKLKEFFPDRYGGPGLNGNNGSARAAASGEFMVKGLGPTTLLGEFADADHSSGGVGAAQAMAEAIWGQILNKESPHGSNQVIALLDTGLSEPLAKGVSQPRYLVVREDPLRPAHMIRNPSRKSDDKAFYDAVRTSKNLERLGGLLGSDPNESIDSKLLRFADRAAEQWGYLHANLIHHGAVSPSNIDLSGAMLDLSSVSSLPGAMPAMGHDPLPFGDFKVVEEYMLKPFYEALKAEGKPEVSISLEDLQKRARDTYHSTYQSELLRVVGAPDALAKKTASLPSAQKLLALLEDLRNAGYSGRIKTKVAVPETLGTYDSTAIIKLMGNTPGEAAPSKELLALLGNLPRGARAAKAAEIQAAFADYYHDLMHAGEGEGYSAEQMAKLIQRRSSNLATTRPGLRRNFASYLKKGAAAIGSRFGATDIQSFVDRSVEENVLKENFRGGPSAYELSEVPAGACRKFFQRFGMAR